MATSTYCIEEIRDAINQIEFYVELKVSEPPRDAEVVERRYQQDIGKAIGRLIELRLEGLLSDESLEKWHALPVDHSLGFVTALIKLTDHMKTKYI
jgi:hypothetical protein